MDFTKIHLMVKRAGVHLAEKRIEGYRKKLVQVIKSWRLEVKFLLSRRYNGKRNVSLWPMLRTGALSKSVPTYIVSTRKRKRAGKLAMDETHLVAKQRDHRAPWNTYGEDLQHWKRPGSQLAGWKTRAYKILDERIEKKFKGLI